MDMEQNWMMTKEQMDNKLKSMNTKVLILRILTHGLVVVGLLAVPQNFFITLACLSVRDTVRSDNQEKERSQEGICLSCCWLCA